MEKVKKPKDPYRFSVGRLFAFKSSDISAAWINLIMLNYLSLYASDTLGVGIGTVGTLLLVSKIFDAFTDVIAGYVVDNTKTKWGKGRPYELGIFGMCICTVLLFSASPEWSQFAKCAWIFCMYTLAFSGFSTFRSTGANPYTIRAFGNNPEALKKVASFGGIITMGGSIIMSVAFPRILAAIGETASGWRMVVLVVMVGAALVGMFRFIFIKEDPSVDEGDKHEKVSVKEIFTLFGKNKYTWLYAIIMLCYNISTNLAAGTYYFKYIVGDLGSLGMVSVFGIALLPLMLLFPWIMKKIGSMGKMVAYFCIFGIAGYLTVFFGETNLGMVYGGLVVGTLATLPIAYYGILFIMNICGYNEMIGLPRMDGSSAILANFATKLGAALGSYITGILLMLAGYVSAEGATTQSTSALMMIRIDYAIVPAICLAIMAVCCFAFAKLEPQVAAFEAQKKAGAEAAVEEA